MKPGGLFNPKTLTVRRVRYSRFRDPVFGLARAWREISQADIFEFAPWAAIPLTLAWLTIGFIANTFIWTFGAIPATILHLLGRHDWEVEERSMTTGVVLHTWETSSLESARRMIRSEGVADTQQ